MITATPFRIVRNLSAIFALIVLLSTATRADAQSINWQPSYTAATAAAASSGKLIMIDVSATWCQYY